MDVKLFDENAPFQVKGLHIAREINNMQRLLLFFLQREEKKKEKKILKYRLISYANAKDTRWTNLTEIGS